MNTSLKNYVSNHIVFLYIEIMNLFEKLQILFFLEDILNLYIFYGGNKKNWLAKVK